MSDITTTAVNVKSDADSGAANARSWKWFVDNINGTWRRGAGDFITCGQYQPPDRS